MVKFSDYFYASVPSVCIALPLAQWMPDLQFLQGIEKLGIVGILAAGIVFFVMERRSFIAKSSQRLETVEMKLSGLETKVSTGNDKVVHLLSEQLDALKEIKNGQVENFARMWNITLKCMKDESHSKENDYGPWSRSRFSHDEDDVLRPSENQKQG